MAMHGSGAGPAANGQAAAGKVLMREGVRELDINRGNIDALAHGAQRIDNARGNMVSDAFMEVTTATIGMVALVIRMVVKLGIVSAHMKNF